MKVNDVITAIARELKSLYPNRQVYIDQIPKKADGNHYVYCTDQCHSKRLDRRRERTYSFVIQYFQSAKDNMLFNDWAETMYFVFEKLDVNGQTVHLTDAHAEPGDDMVYHFVFDVKVNGLVVDVQPGELIGDLMMDLQARGGLKS
ncbi:phage tail terminator family protein [Paenibacillus popilliae]|uniref:Outer membrane protein n=1 Tax=Paenibacillus popilliae ATCC 14706 TaxID=1212764 RepID=M9L968_PAEPP|nr:hypothetical protein [Paenibacillus popilliae]GAC41902.1 outer membrane protein [Paenibacillus popilliae ATCC 14706]